MTTQTNKLIAYTPQSVPTVDGVTLVYLQREFKAIQTAIKSIQTVMRELETRIAALGG
jgi:hypothetical protein